MSSGNKPGQGIPTFLTGVPELTIRAVVLALVLSVVMGAANVYLGLKAGMTVSASIPAAVIAMGVLRGLFRGASILESNLVQTAASAGESLAAGIIFTMPALILVGVWEDFDFWTTSLIALAGGLLGILFMIPMRRVFVVENTELKYPEGVACAEVLRAGSSGELDSDEGPTETGFVVVMVGVLLGANFKFATSFLSVLQGAAEWASRIGNRVVFLGADLSPALLAVVFIVVLPIAVQIFVGGAIGWLITIPMLATTDLDAKTPVEMAYELWSTQVRYMGVGAMIVGGIASIWRVRGGLLAAFGELGTLIQGDATASELDATERNLGGKAIVGLSMICIALTAGIYFTLLKYDVGLTALATIVMVVMAFFFSAVASYIVGLVGNSNSPVSGMTITAVLGTGLMITVFGFGGDAGILATLGVAGVVCCVACTSGDVCNDLKTGHLVGASPRSQQIMQILGVAVAAFVLAPVMTVLHQGSINNGTGGIGGGELPAPQAGLFAALARGFFGDEPLPYTMVMAGVWIGVALLLVDLLLVFMKSEFRLHVMPVAVGMYLPFGLAPPILLGGLVHAAIRWFARHKQSRGEEQIRRGVLLTSGIIAGESLVGVLLGFLAWQELTAQEVSYSWRAIVSLAAFLAVAVFVFAISRKVTEDDVL